MSEIVNADDSTEIDYNAALDPLAVDDGRGAKLELVEQDDVVFVVKTNKNTDTKTVLAKSDDVDVTDGSSDDVPAHIAREMVGNVILGDFAGVVHSLYHEDGRVRARVSTGDVEDVSATLILN